MNNLIVKEADFSDVKHTDAILKLTDAYASDPMGLGKPLSDSTRQKLMDELRKFPGSICFIAFLDGEVAGLANCFYSFSTFSASRIINLHDLAVLSEYRRKGIGSALLDAVEKKAREENCSKITLEVRHDNRARNLYERFGFSYGETVMYFMSKSLE